jgi:hypothetical protein
MGVVEAYGFVGYSTTSRNGAYRLERKPNIKDRMSSLQGFKAEEVVKVTGALEAVTRSEIIESIRDTRRLAKDGVPVINTKGSATGAMRVDLAQANRSDELLAKMHGFLLDVSREETLDEELDGKKPEELREFVLSLLEQLDPNLRKMVAAELELSSAVEDEDEAEERVLQ